MRFLSETWVPMVSTDIAYAVVTAMKCPEALDHPWYQTQVWVSKWGPERFLTVSKCHNCGEVMPMAPIKFNVPGQRRKKDVWHIGRCSVCKVIYWAPTRKGKS